MVLVEYDESEEIVRAKLPKRGKRKSWKLGEKLTVEKIETEIAKGQSEN